MSTQSSPCRVTPGARAEKSACLPERITYVLLNTELRGRAWFAAHGIPGPIISSLDNEPVGMVFTYFFRDAQTLEMAVDKAFVIRMFHRALRPDGQIGRAHV